MSHHVFAVVALLAAAIASSRPETVLAQEAKPLSESDSVRNRREAAAALRQYWRLVGEFWAVHPRPELNPDKMQIQALCEQPLGNYCHGPDNGRIAYGSRIVTMPVEFLMADKELMSRKRGVARKTHADLLKSLDRFQAVAPGDRWIMGQRVFHRVERGDLNDAASIAQRCRSDLWWCAALVGYTKHLLGLNAAADSAFAAAIATMPDSMRCEWEDLGILLDGDPLSGWYSELDCARRIGVNDTLWWLADPLYMVPRNERRTTHHVRLVHAKLARDSDARLPPHVDGVPMDPVWWPPHGEQFGWAIIRMGVPGYLAFGVPDQGTSISVMRQPPVLALQYRKPFYHFLPSLAAVQAPMTASRATWTPEIGVPSTEHYRPAFGRFSQPASQIAWFRRASSARIVGAFDVASDSMLRRAGLIGGALAIMPSPGSPPKIIPRLSEAAWIFAANVPADSTMVSFEALAPSVGAGRARYASGPPPMPQQRVTMSDVLLMTSAEPLPTDLETAARRAAPSTVVSPLEPLGLYWEVYGLVGVDSVTVSLTVTGSEPSMLARLGAQIGLGGGTGRAEVRWNEERVGANGISPQSIAFDIRSLDRGTYTLELKVEVIDQQPVSVRREIIVAGR